MSGIDYEVILDVQNENGSVDKIEDRMSRASHAVLMVPPRLEYMRDSKVCGPSPWLSEEMGILQRSI